MVTESLPDAPIACELALGEPFPYLRIDHIAIAVRDLESAISFFRDILGFSLIRRHSVRGQKTGMVSAEMENRDILCQGTEQESQVSRLIENFGPGVAHIALGVTDVESTRRQLLERGLSFDTDLISGPGLEQTFSSRCNNSGLSFEFISRNVEQSSFLDENIQSLFDQLEKNDTF
jgi:methylmalonyl-CoA/ethylmalonyl-CoA epimerase